MTLFDVLETGWDRLHLVRPEQFTDGDGSQLDWYRVAPGDAVPKMSGERCEGMAYTDGDPGDRHRWTWRTRFPAGFQPNPETLWNFWTQWHATDSLWPQAPVALTVRTYGGQERLVLRVMGGASQAQRYHDLGPLERGITRRWRVDFVWGCDEGVGSTQVYRDGLLLATDVGPNCYPGDAGTYMKQGYYRGASGLETVVRHGRARCDTF